MLARELPKKRRPTEVSALIIGSAGAIGWHNPNLKVDMACMRLLMAYARRRRAAPCGRAHAKAIFTKAIFTKENTNE
jgi:hypothetical protein